MWTRYQKVDVRCETDCETREFSEFREAIRFHGTEPRLKLSSIERERERERAWANYARRDSPAAGIMGDYRRARDREQRARDRAGTRGGDLRRGDVGVCVVGRCSFVDECDSDSDAGFAFVLQAGLVPARAGVCLERRAGFDCAVGK